MRTTTTEVDNASTLIVLERRSKDERQQRAKGTFVSSTANEPGPHLKRVSLEFDSRVVGTPPLDCCWTTSMSASRGTGEGAIVENPSRWEVRIDLPVFYGGAGSILVPNVPRFMAVETLGGNQDPDSARLVEECVIGSRGQGRTRVRDRVSAGAPV